jgi:hypothetical protein
VNGERIRDRVVISSAGTIGQDGLINPIARKYDESGESSGRTVREKHVPACG